MKYATYQVTDEKHGRGTFFVTDCCGNIMYSLKGCMAYHGKICPKCLWQKGEQVTLYLRGTEEANAVMKERYSGKQ